MPLDRIGLEVERVELLQPGGAVGREHAVGRAASGQDLAALEHDVVLARCAGRRRGRRGRRGRWRRAPGRTGRRRGWRRPPGRGARSPGRRSRRWPAPWRTIRRTPWLSWRRPSSARSASSASTLCRMNSTRRSARGSGSRRARSKTKAHQTRRAALRAWNSAAWSLLAQVAAKPDQGGIERLLHRRSIPKRPGLPLSPALLAAGAE